MKKPCMSPRCVPHSSHSTGWNSSAGGACAWGRSRLHSQLAPPLAAHGLARTARLHSAPVVDPDLCTALIRHAQRGASRPAASHAGKALPLCTEHLTSTQGNFRCNIVYVLTHEHSEETHFVCLKRGPNPTCLKLLSSERCGVKCTTARPCAPAIADEHGTEVAVAFSVLLAV